ncbi:MAG: hypothetical protein L3K26_06450 [Candidatus Hydrogenedentes bacterium]|nr:hypothetical protein [Candidatus Hydrogenedentota bacterium]
MFGSDANLHLFDVLLVHDPEFEAPFAKFLPVIPELLLHIDFPFLILVAISLDEVIFLQKQLLEGNVALGV